MSADGTRLVSLLTDLAQIAYQSLGDTRLGCPGSGYLSHDEPPEDCCDFVALWTRSWTPYIAGQFPSEQAEFTNCQPLEWNPDLVLSLRRPCSPDLKYNPDNPFPERAEETSAASDLMIDARALQCAVLRDWPVRLAVDYPGSILLAGTMSATGGSTGCFGWDWDIRIETPGCRSQCGPAY